MVRKLSAYLTEERIQSQEDMATPSSLDVAINTSEITMEELDRAPMKLEDLKAEVQDPLLEIDLGTDGNPKPTYISQFLSEEDKVRMVTLLKEYKDCFA